MHSSCRRLGILNSKNDRTSLMSCHSKSMVDWLLGSDHWSFTPLVHCHHIVNIPHSFRGFMKYKRATYQYRPSENRLEDWKEVFNHADVMSGIRSQAARYVSNSFSSGY